jgi:FkbM family methyltransferase
VELGLRHLRGFPAGRAELVEALKKEASFARSSRIHRLSRRPLRFARLAVRRHLPWQRRVLVTVTTFFHDQLRVELSRTAQEVYKYGIHEADLTMACLLLVQPGAVFVDIGANFGYFTLLAARLVGDGGKVYAFEPTPRTADVLQLNVEKQSNVVVERSAVFSRSGVAELTDYGSEWSGFNTLLGRSRASFPLAGEKCVVPIVTLDEYFQDKAPPTFVKIDAESAEMDILRGMEHILTQVRPIVSLEVGDPTGAAASPSRCLVDLLTDRGYVPYQLADHELVAHRSLARYDLASLVFVPSEMVV